MPLPPIQPFQSVQKSMKKPMRMVSAVAKMYRACKIFSMIRYRKLQVSWRNLPNFPIWSRRLAGTIKMKASTVAAMASTSAIRPRVPRVFREEP